MEIRQLVDAACAFDGDPAARVEAEEPDARLVVGRDVRAHVELRECRDPRQRHRSAQAQAGDDERRDADPRAAVELLDLEALRHEAGDALGADAPVREEELVPGLAHHPRFVGQRPRPVRVLRLDGRLPGRRCQELRDQIRARNSNRLPAGSDA